MRWVPSRGGAGEGLGRGAWPDGRLSPQEIRKVVQALEQTAREILTLLQGVHQGAGFQDSESAFPGAVGNSRLGRREGSERPPRGTPVPLSRAPRFRVLVARGRSWGVLRGLLGGCWWWW